MKLSFIIASVDRKEFLQNCLTSIEKAYAEGDFDIETLVVLQNSKEKKETVSLKYPHLTMFYHIEETGLSAARNYAIKKSTGDLLIFLDDDAEVRSDFLKVLTEKFSASEAEAFCGRILEKDTRRCYALCFADQKKKYLKRKDYKYFMGSAHVFKKSLIEKIGLYDEQFGAGAKYPAAEESDMFFRAKRQGARILYIPELVFFHSIPEKTSAKKVYNYFYAGGAMLSKQIISHKKHFYLYLSFLIVIVVKSFIRIIQVMLFYENIKEKDARFHFRSVFKGTIKGTLAYIREAR